MARRWTAGLTALAAALIGSGLALFYLGRAPVVQPVGYGDLVQTLAVSREGAVTMIVEQASRVFGS